MVTLSKVTRRPSESVDCRPSKSVDNPPTKSVECRPSRGSLFLVDFPRLLGSEEVDARAKDVRESIDDDFDDFVDFDVFVDLFDFVVAVFDCGGEL